MSRVGKMPIPVPSGVKVEIQGRTVQVEGPKGKLSHELPEVLTIERKEANLHVTRSSEEKRVKSLHGLHKSLVQNMVKGVTDGYTKELELVGVGYKAAITGTNLEMFVGFTHAVVYPIPKGITLETPKPTQVVVRGIDKYLVGQVAARIRAFAKPEPYKGKGIKYVGEVIRRKAGKAVA
ncbi:MAG: 50S ribosomal protein L6 [Candidatus Omnitrophica bacterium]|nr:50S ribosomal protein L6 [Candidatus Omnitrophota bacterium]